MQQARSKRIKPNSVVERVCAWSGQDERNADHDDEEVIVTIATVRPQTDHKVLPLGRIWSPGMHTAALRSRLNDFIELPPPSSPYACGTPFSLETKY